MEAKGRSPSATLPSICRKNECSFTSSPPISRRKQMLHTKSNWQLPKRWDRSGTVVETNDFDSYTLKVNGTGRVSRRNRKYLRQFQPASPNIRTASPLSSIVDSKLMQKPPNSVIQRDKTPASNVEEQLDPVPHPNVPVGPVLANQPENRPTAITPELLPSASTRPVRARRCPEKYDAATGQWGR